MTETETPLPELEELFQKVFRNLPVGAFVLQNRKFKMVNPRFQEFLGYPMDELLSMDCLEPVHPEDRGLVRENAIKWLKGESASPYEYRFISRDGTVGWAMETVIPGQFQGKRAALGYFVNISRRKSTEQALRQSEEKLRLIFQSAAEGVTVTDLNGSIIEANEVALKIHGCDSRSNFVGRKGLEFITERDRERWKEHMRQLLKGKPMGAVEYTLLKADGTEFPGELVASLLKDASGKPVGFIGVTRDITERKRLQENMQFYIAQITKAQEEERRRIARELHDETAQSLATLLLDIEAIRRSGDNLPDETLHLLAQLRTKINSTLEGVRHFSHELRPDILDQLGLLSALELLTEEMNQQNTIKAYLEVIGSPQRLSSEAELVLFRIAQEALRNVRKHSHALEAVVRIEFTGKKSRMQVIDNGCGFEPPRRVFDLVDNGQLGLVGMYERARLLDGSFTVKSEPGKGTTITVEVAI